MMKESFDVQYNENIVYYKYSWWQLMRPMTLTGTVTPILVGTGFARMSGAIHFDTLFALLVASLLIQAATNMLNDYYDYKHGQDVEKWTLEKTETSHITHNQILPVALIMHAIAVIIGLWLATMTTFWIIPIGTIGIVAGYRYSAGTHSFSAIGLGEVVGAIFLGGATTILAYVVQGHTVNLEIIFLSIPFATLIASMILTNNIRDIKKDEVFRNTIAILVGRKKAVTILFVLLLIAYLSVLAMIVFGTLPWIAGFVYLATPLAIKLLYCYRDDANRQEEMIGMKWAALHHWSFGIIFAVTLWII